MLFFSSIIKISLPFSTLKREKDDANTSFFMAMNIYPTMLLSCFTGVTMHI